MRALDAIGHLRRRAESSQEQADRDDDAWLTAVMEAVRQGATWTEVARRSGMARTTIQSRVAVYRRERQRAV